MSQDPKQAVSRESDKFMLRVPEGMRDRISDAAAQNRRSMNAEVVERLERTFRWDAVEHPHPQELSSEIQSAAQRLQELIHEFRMLQVDRDASLPPPASVDTEEDDVDLPNPRSVRSSQVALFEDSETTKPGSRRVRTPAPKKT